MNKGETDADIFSKKDRMYVLKENYQRKRNTDYLILVFEK